MEIRGKFIVIYGINNLGKSTQAKLLVERLAGLGREVKYIKYPIYTLPPSGAMIDEYLRKGNPSSLTPREAQILYAFNRSQYEPQLIADLEAGVSIVAEDYRGTGIAWGMGEGVDEKFLKELNAKFLPENLALLFVGKRFFAGVEEKHLYETDVALTQRAEAAHRKLAQEFGWKLIDANHAREEVSDALWSEVKEIL